MRVFSICVLVYFLACPSVSLRSQNGGNREPGIVAHRGYWNTEGAAQNSVTALKNAQKMGLYGSEMDVWLTKDGYLVVGHDKKMNGLSFQDTDYDLLKDMKLSNGEKLPQLKDFLVQLKQSESPTKLFIEIKKHDSFERNMTVVKAVLDTDAYNEIDDQFAILYAMLSPEKIDLQAIYAALFYNGRSSSPADGMEKSYQEILKICGLTGRDPEGFVFRGCRAPLEGPELPQESEAVNDLIRKARQASPDDPLYVIGIGACTNIASAILKCPEIIENLVVVWLGGNTRDWVYPSEFNLSQDLAAGQVLFDCGVPLVQIPAFGVTNFLITTVPELEACLAGKNKICDYLVDNVKAYSNDHFAWSKAIWDVGAVAYLVNSGWTPSSLIHAPVVVSDHSYAFDERRHFIRSVQRMDRDAIFRDLFTKLGSCHERFPQAAKK